MRRFAVLLPALAACAGPSAAPDADAARAWALSGPFRCVEGPRSWTLAFAPDGTHAWEFEGRRVAGAWRVDASGRMCTADDEDPREQCFQLRLAGRTADVTRPRGGGGFRCAPA